MFHGFTSHRSLRASLAGLAASAALGATGGAGAGCPTDFSFVREFGVTGTGVGEFDQPLDVAVSDALGTIYVVENDNNGGVVQRWSTLGFFIDEFPMNEQFAQPEAIAIDGGTVWVVTQDAVESFDLNGIFQSGFVSDDFAGVADSVNGIDKRDGGNIHLAVGGTVADEVRIHATDGTLVDEFGVPIEPLDVAVDSTGRILVMDRVGQRVRIYESDGTFVQDITDNFDIPLAIAVDAADNIYVGDTENQRVAVYTPGGSFITQIDSTSGAGTFEPVGVTVDAQGNVYVVDNDFFVAGGRVLIFEPVCPTGACCFPDGTCQFLEEPACGSMGGLFQGDTVACNPCPQPGACCLPDGSCRLESLVGDAGGQAACAGDGGTYEGDGTTCTPDPCIIACCFDDGSCTPLSEPDCATQGGQSQGAGSDCAVDGCPQPGACCFDDGSCTVGVEVDGEDCTGQGGVYQGADTTCDVGTSCAAACCFDDGTCQLLSVAVCAQTGGTYQGFGVDCAQAACPQPGACCLPDGSCRQESLIGEAGGEAACLGGGGAYQGDDTLCADVICTQPGACCLPDGSCRQESLIGEAGGEAACLGDGGAYQGDDTLCAGVICTQPGACCLPDGSCRQEMLIASGGGEAACIGDGGAYQGDDTLCANVSCPQPGACCFPDGNCAIMMLIGSGGGEASCSGQGGVYQGDDTVCNPCPQPGACCMPDGSCAQSIEIAGPDCQGPGFSYQGDDTLCANVSCPLPADLVVTKVDDVDPALLGHPLVYSINVRNDGPGDADNVIVTDLLPDGVLPIESDGLVVVNIGVLASGASADVEIPVQVAAPTIPHCIFQADGLVTLAGERLAACAAFGPMLDPEGVTGTLVAVEPADACMPLTNAIDVAGHIALIEMDGCSAVTQVRNAQDAGAIAAVIVGAAGSQVEELLDDGTGGDIAIPSVMINLPDGQVLHTALGQAAGFTVTVRYDVPTRVWQIRNEVSVSSDAFDLDVSNNVDDEATTVSTDCDDDGVADTEQTETDFDPNALDANAQDLCTDAEQVCPGFTYVGHTMGATRSAAPNQTLFCGSYFGVYDVWYCYRPRWTGSVFASLQGPPADWLLGVYDDCPGAGGQQIACGASPSGVSFTAQFGRTYYLRIAARNFEAPLVPFNLTLTGPDCLASAEDADANGVPDACDCPEDVDGDGAVTMSDFLQVTLAVGQPCDGCPEDIDGNGVVDATDQQLVLVVLTAKGGLCPTVPLDLDPWSGGETAGP